MKIRVKELLYAVSQTKKREHLELGDFIMYKGREAQLLGKNDADEWRVRFTDTPSKDIEKTDRWVKSDSANLKKAMSSMTDVTCRVTHAKQDTSEKWQEKTNGSIFNAVFTGKAPRRITDRAVKSTTTKPKTRTRSKSTGRPSNAFSSKKRFETLKPRQ